MGNAEKRRAIFDKHRCNADLLIVQETHSTQEIENIWECEWGGKAIYSHGTSAARGIAIFIQKEHFNKVHNIYVDSDGRVIIFDFIDQLHTVTIVAIYAPNIDCPIFFQEIGEKLKNRGEHKIVIGDFNLVLDIEKDRENTYNNNSKAQEEVFNLMDQYYLKDVWRIQNGEKREFSWRKKGSRPVKASRIDFALVTAGLDQKVTNTSYLSSIKTDHRGIYMVIDLFPFTRGTGYWKFNNSLLRDKNFIEGMNSSLDQILEIIDEENPKENWELIKKKIKEFSIEFSKNKVSDDKIIIANLSEIVEEYEAKLPLPEEEYDLLEKTKLDLEEKTLERIRGVMFRSKAKWFEEGEKNTKYFFSLEKSRYNAKTCYKLITEDGQEVTEQKQILNLQKMFYTELYQKDDFVKFDMINNSGTKVPYDIKLQQDQQITPEEIGEALLKMNRDKTPGEDGITADFYKIFWAKLKKPFLT